MISSSLKVLLFLFLEICFDENCSENSLDDCFPEKSPSFICVEHELAMFFKPLISYYPDSCTSGLIRIYLTFKDLSGLFT